MVDRSLYNQGIRSIGIHGDKSRVKRDKAMALFRNNKANVLVATDVASRGLDIPNVKYVVLYDLPQDITDFVHRAGRTGRRGSEGHCVTIFNS
ncbi:UNVERIFIED_CONTAM: hypothetical protein GTU68_006350, partial [Idotea baltica]|nr:hypothetical protein [Idotea baltica]